MDTMNPHIGMNFLKRRLQSNHLKMSIIINRQYDIIAILKHPLALTTNLEEKTEWKMCQAFLKRWQFLHLTLTN